MVEYKGFNIPETKDEIINLINQNGCAILADPKTVVIKNEGNSITLSIILNEKRFSVPLSLEDPSTLTFETIDQTIKNLIDCATSRINIR